VAITCTFFFAVTLLLSSLLLFVIQPMVGKMVLPWLGGTPAVWNTCLLFFQIVLLAAFAYAHASGRWLRARASTLVHVGLLLIPLVILALGALGWLAPLLPFRVAAAPAGGNPVVATLGVLLVAAGLPFFVVAATAPLLQKWFAETGHPAARDPYFLYAASNLGSMLALVSYPLWVEPRLTLRAQGDWWATGYVALFVLIAGCAALVWLSPRLFVAQVLPAPQAGAGSEAGGRPTALRRLRWVALAAVPASLLLGVTTYLTTDIAPLPLLWAFPLALYLLTFVLAFTGRTLVVRLPGSARLIIEVALGGVIGLLLLAVVASFVLSPGPDSPLAGAAGFAAVALAVLGLLVPHRWLIFAQPLAVLGAVYSLLTDPLILSPLGVALNLLAFYVTVRVCHGELARDRPASPYLTEFFLWLAVGGALGGLFNVFVAPQLFRRGLVEYPLGLVLGCMLRPSWLANGGSDWLLALALTSGSRSREEGRRLRRLFARLFDFLVPVLPAALALAVVTLFLPSSSPSESVARWLIPLLLLGMCLLVAARSLRFGLALGAVLIVFAWQRGQHDAAVYADRSPFGLLRVREGSELRVGGPGGFGGRGAFDERLPYLNLMHGTTDHGFTYRKPRDAQQADFSRLATTYYHKKGPLGLVMERFNWWSAANPDTQPADPGRPMDPDISKETVSGPGNFTTFQADYRLPASLVACGPAPLGPLFAAWSEPPVAVVGLGPGTVVSYARPYQHVVCYEVDNLVKELSLPSRTGAGTYFTHLDDALRRGVRLDVVIGDARVKMAQGGSPAERYFFKQPSDDRPQMVRIQHFCEGYYQIIVVDAFNSDAIPVHLLTREAFRLYASKLAPGGILCLHTSNRYIDLVPLIAATSNDLGLLWRRGHDSAPVSNRGGRPPPRGSSRRGVGTLHLGVGDGGVPREQTLDGPARPSGLCGRCPPPGPWAGPPFLDVRLADSDPGLDRRLHQPAGGPARLPARQGKFGRSARRADGRAGRLPGCGGVGAARRDGPGEYAALCAAPSAGSRRSPARANAAVDRPLPA
jgi:hypothetical protein